MAMDGQQAGHLRLERRHANLAFSSWRLSSTLVQAQGSVALPGPVAPPQATDTDYVTARHAALLNGLTQQPRGCYLFLEGQPGAAGAAALQLCAVEVGEGGKPPLLHRLAGVAVPPAGAPAGGLDGGALPPSVVEVQAPVAAGDAAGSLLLVSGGHGDVSLVAPLAGGQQGEWAAPAGGSSLSPPIFPLRPAPPLLGARPLHLAAAFALPPEALGAVGGAAGSVLASGEAQLCAIAWAARHRSGRHPSCCEVYAVHMAAAMHPAPALRVLGVQLLKTSDLPPHGVLVNAATGGVLLALQPPSAGAAEDEAAAQHAAAAAAGGGGASAGTAAMDGDDAEDDMSPRTLQAAVARLAAFTSEEPVGPLPHQQYADLYREAGADGVGAMGSEPTCTLYTFALAAASAADGQAAQQAQQPGAAGQPSGQPLLRLVHTLSCQPHKLLTCHLEQPAAGAQEPPTPDTHLQGGGAVGGPCGAAAASGDGGGSGGSQASPRLLLGLTDDVDCAVVAIGCCTGPEAAAAGRGGGAAAGPEETAARFVIQHVASVPALSYVAAGKVQRKFLLLAPPGGDVAAALVEASKYCYVYRATAPRQEYGDHQVVDMELPDSGGRGALGAVLAGSRAGACRLVVLGREGLHVIDM